MAKEKTSAPIEHLEAKAALLDLVNMVKNYPEVEPADPQQNETFNPQRWVKGQTYINARPIGNDFHGLNALDNPLHLLIDAETGKLRLEFWLGHAELKQYLPEFSHQQLQEAFFECHSKSKNQPHYSALEEKFLPLREKIARDSKDCKILQQLLGEQTNIDLKFDGHVGISSDGRVKIQADIELDFGKLDIPALVNNAQNLHKKFLLDTDNIMQTRVGEAANAIHERTQQLNNDQLSQFLSSLLLALCMRRNPGVSGHQTEMAQAIAKQTEDNIKKLAANLKKLSFVSQHMQMAGDVGAAMLKQMNVSGSLNLNVSPEVLIQILGPKGVEHLAPQLQGPAKLFLEALEEGRYDQPLALPGVTTAPANSPASQPAVGEHSAKVRKQPQGRHVKDT